MIKGFGKLRPSFTKGGFPYGSNERFDGLSMHVLSSNGQHYFGIPSANRLGQLTGRNPL